MTPDAGEIQVPVRRRPGGPPKGDRRRQAIVRAVEELLQARTIAELSVENVAAAAGISRSGFYFYFESKYAALAEALRDVADEMTRAAEDFFAGTDDPPQAYVPRALRGVSELWRRHANLMIAVVDAAHSDAGARALWDEWIERFAIATAERIEVERAAGRAPAAGPPARELASALMLMNQAVFDDDARRDVRPERTGETVGSLTHVWLSSIWGIHPTP